MASPTTRSRQATTSGADISTGTKIVGNITPLQLTSETGPLTYGIWIIPQSNANFWVHMISPGFSAASSTTGMFVKKSNPLFIPIKDPSVIRIISGGNNKTVTFIMY